MEYEQHLKQGKLAEALASLESEVRLHPSLPKHRIFLFQLLSVMGQWERAAKQLDVIRKLDDGALAMVHMYQAAISCELFRESVFQGKHDPIFLGQPAEWQALLIQAHKLVISGNFTEAQKIREQAFELAPASFGEIDGQPFSWIADADMRLGPVLEIILNGKYYWVPYAQVQTITLELPVDLRDLVWLPAHIRWQNEGESYVLIPSRYPGSTSDNQLALGRKTQWTVCGDDLYIGKGQRILTTDIDDFSLFDIRAINISVH